MDQKPNFDVIHPGEKGITMPKKNNVSLSYPFRFEDEEKKMYVYRTAYLTQHSVQKTMDDFMYHENWRDKNERYKSMIKKMGLTDRDILKKVRGKRVPQRKAA